MAVEDIALFRALAGSTVLYPSDGASTVALTERMARLDGISYLRTTREATASLYGADDEFPVGGSKKLASSDEDDGTLVGAGLPLQEGVPARDPAAPGGIRARVIDCYSAKPIDEPALRTAFEQTVVVV